MPNALVVNPWAEDFKLYDEWMHPIGLYLLTSLLRHNGWHVDVLDFLVRQSGSHPGRNGTGNFARTNIEKPALFRSIPRRYKRYGLAVDDAARMVLAHGRPDVILIGSAMTYWLGGLIATVRLLEEHVPGVPIVVGGIAATLAAGFLRQCLARAIVWPGPVLDADLSSHPIHPALRSITTTSWVPRLTDGLPCDARPRHGPLLLTFGCPLRCSYCASAVLQPRYHARSMATVIEEVDCLVTRHGVRDLAVYDDALLYEAEERLLPLLDALAPRLDGVRLHTPNGLHAKWVTPRVAEAMKASGFVTVRLGYESGSPRDRSHVSGKANRDAVERAARTFTDAGFANDDIGVYIMGGLPDQTPGEVLEEVSFIKALGVRAKPVMLAPIPGTAVFEHYATRFPAIRTDPLWHNDTFFVTNLAGWSWEAVQEIRDAAKQRN